LVSLPVTDEATPALPEDAVEVARVLGAWGVKGGLKLKAFSSDPQALFSTKRWFLQPSEQPRPTVQPAPGLKTTAAFVYPLLLRVTQAREQGDSIVALVQEVADRDAAEALKGARVFISRGSFPTPGENEFYWVDLIGLAVLHRDGSSLGEVVGLLETGPHCVLRIAPADASQAEVLIPFVSAYVDTVDTAQRRIVVDWSADY
jgi:16S rRNA processing protein RimM